MVDEYGNINLPESTLKTRSDSSMVDEYNTSGRFSTLRYEVQIPLWSMNTLKLVYNLPLISSSDSSMVDEYTYGN